MTVVCSAAHASSKNECANALRAGELTPAQAVCAQTLSTQQATADAYNNPGTQHQKNGQTALAENYYRRAIAILDRTASPDEAALAAHLLNLATLLTNRQLFDDAKKPLLRLLKIRSRMEGAESAGVADIHNRLGVLYHHTGSAQKAEEQLRKALSMREQSLGTNHILVAESCTNLGTLLMQLGRLDEALPLLRHAAAVTQTSTGPQSASTKASWEHLEQLYGRLIQKSSQGSP
ncbi:MAG: tetratricopeptide repeat protein [Pseudomonas sp.]